jgi:hypothetical protein
MILPDLVIGGAGFDGVSVGGLWFPLFCGWNVVGIGIIV